MKKWLVIWAFATLSLMADYTAQPIDQPFIESKIKIIDIRTPTEWNATGLVKGSIPIMFFNDQGGYDMEDFLQKLNQVIVSKERFALICNSGSRSKVVGKFLGEKMGYSVIDLQGGIQYAIVKKIPFEPYRPKP
jgi:rhodanese-related sulfurtransferase